jgi:hypothetical protein
MKLETKKQIDFTSNASFDGYDATISKHDMHKLWDMLQNPYKNPIGAVVREYVSNSFDSHAEAKFIKEHSIEEIKNEYSIYQTAPIEELEALKQAVEIFSDDAVIVTIDKDDTGWFWATEDFGVGLSPSRIKDVFVNYLKSTKETSNTMIGAFGMGSKSGLSYADVVFIRTRYNSIEYSYMLRKGENGPRLDIIGEAATTERNGTEIKVYIEIEDVAKFRTSCKEQLAYFDNVYFSYYCEIPNNFQIIKGDSWLATTGETPQNDLHICLGKVAYPIDWKILEIPRIDFPVALQFQIGELDVIQTREDVKYTPRTKEAIYKKLIEFETELRKRWAESSKECSTIEEFYAKRNEVPTLYFAQNQIALNLKQNGLFSIQENGYYYKPFEDAGLAAFMLPKDYTSLFFDYYTSGQFSARFQKYNGDAGALLTKANRSPYQLVMRVSQEHEPRKSKFIKHTFNKDVLFFIRKKTRLYLKYYVSTLKLKTVSKDKWRGIITAYQKIIQKEVIDKTTSYDKVVPTKEWLESQKKTKAKRDTTEIQVKTSKFYFNNSDSKNTEKRKISDFLGSNRTLFFLNSNDATPEVNRNIRLVYLTYKAFTKTPDKFMQYCEVAPTNLKKLKNVKNQVTMESFLSEENKVFRRMVSMVKLYKNHSDAFSKLKRMLVDENRIKLLKVLSPTVSSDLKMLSDTFLKFNKLIGAENRIYGDEKFLQDTCYKLAVQNNSFDKKLEEDFFKILRYSEQLDIIDFIDTSGYRFDKNIGSIVEFIAEAIYLQNKFKTKHRFPLNIHYKIYFNSKFKHCKC